MNLHRYVPNVFFKYEFVKNFKIAKLIWQWDEMDIISENSHKEEMELWGCCDESEKIAALACSPETQYQKNL